MTLTSRRAPGSLGPRPPLPAVTPAPPPPVSLRPTLPARGLRGLVRLYQLVFSGRPSPCRYYPSCSAYAVEALEVHGAARGSWLTVRRLLRCHPWGGHGVDPVPPPAVPPTHRPAPVPSAPAPVPN